MTERHFETGGAAYAAFRPTWPPELVPAIVGPLTEHALDVGCGTGQLARCLADSFARVTATDPSASQVAHAVPHPRIRYRIEAAEQIGLPDDSVDLVVAGQAAHWFELDGFYAEARRVARPDARLALVTYGVPCLDGPGRDRLDRFYWHDIHGFWPAPRRHVERAYRDLPFPFVELPWPALAIERRWTVDELLGYVGTWSAVRRARTAGRGALFDRFAEELREAWGDPQPRVVRWPVGGRLGRLGAKKIHPHRSAPDSGPHSMG